MGTLKDVMDFFGDDIPVGPVEMMEFWQSLTEEERDIYRLECFSMLRPI